VIATGICDVMAENNTFSIIPTGVRSPYHGNISACEVTTIWRFVN